MKKTYQILLLALVTTIAHSQNPTRFYGSDNLVNTSTALNQQSPDVAMDASGNYIIVWEGRDVSSAGILAQRYNASGVKQGGEFVVNTTTLLGQAQPAVAMDQDGDFVVVWYTGQGALFKINGQRYNSAGIAQGTEFQINTTLSQDPIFADVAMNADGDFIVTWHNSSGNYDIYARRYNASGVAQGGEFVVNTTTTNIQAYPAVALADDGTFVIVWHSESFIGANDDDLYAQRFKANGTKTGNEFRVNTYTNNFQTRAEIGMDASGNFVICWWGGVQDGSQTGVFAQQYSKNGTKKGEEFQVNTTATMDQRIPSIAVEPNGNFMIAWESEHLSGIEDEEDVFMQYFHRNGSKIGDEIQVNTTTADVQRDARVATRRNGRYALVWQSNNQVSPTSDADIYQELFEPVNYIVNTTDDVLDGVCNTIHCSLRDAITVSNGDGVRSFIEFDISGTAPFIIQPISQLPTLNQVNTVIDATTQPNWSLGDIVVDGSSAGFVHGFPVQSNGTLIKGFEIRNFTLQGILLNSGFSSIEVLSNTIHSNGSNAIIISFSTSSAIIKDNYLGTNATLDSGLGHGLNGIGGSMQNSTIENNIIVSNGQDGIGFTSNGNNKIVDNYIGINPFTLADMGNTRNGILLSGANSDTIQNNTVAYSGQTGIHIGTATTAIVTENSIFCNIGGILSPETAPTVSTISQTSIIGTSAANQKIEVFLSDTTDCSTAPCQGKTFLGTTTADVAGNWTLDAPYFVSLPPLARITATATNTTTSPVITSGFASCQILTNDDCAAAFDLVVNSAACVGTTTKASNAGATSSTPLPVGACASTFSGGDIWFKAILPFSGNMLIRKREGTEIQAVVEAYQGTCGSLTAIDCKQFNAEPNVLIIDLDQADAGSTIYFRVWDDGNDDVGDVILSAHFLKNNPEKWEICGDPLDDEDNNTSIGASRRVANEFVVQYDQDTTGLAINNIELEQSANLDKSCNCSTRTLQLWRTSTPDTVEISIDTALTLQNILQTSYNYIIGEQPCTGLGQRVRFPPNIYTPQINYSDSVRVAIIDSGVDTKHPLLENAFRQNPNPNEGCLPNDTIGYDFVNGLGIPTDNDGHGTWVNGALVRGFPNEIKLDLMNMKFKEVDDGSLFDAICGIYHAIEEQAEIIILSWNFRSNEFPQIFFDALDEARKNGILVVTAAGNTPENNDNRNKYPSNFDLDNIMTVTSYEADLEGQNIRLGHYASFGKNTVDIAALGFLETTDIGDQDNPFQLTSVAGTTLAAPLVARTAAIIKGNFPNLNYQHIKDCILSSAQRNASLKDRVVSKGYLDHDQAMLCAKEKSSMISNACLTSNLMLSAQVTADNCNMGEGSIDLTLTNATNPSFLWSTDAITEDINNLYAGNYKVTVTDASGCVLAENIEVMNTCMSLRERYEQTEPAARIVTKKLNRNQKISILNPLHTINLRDILTVPNPFKDQIQIQFFVEEKGDVQIKIYDLKGQLWYEKEQEVGEGQQFLSLETEHFPRGFFIIHLENKTFSWQQKIVKIE